MKWLGFNWKSVKRGLYYASAIGLGFVGATYIEQYLRTGYWGNYGL